MPIFTQSASVAPDVNWRITAAEKACKQRIQPGRGWQMSPEGVLVTPRKDLVSSKNFKKNGPVTGRGGLS